MREAGRGEKLSSFPTFETGVFGLGGLQLQGQSLGLPGNIWPRPQGLRTPSKSLSLLPLIPSLPPHPSLVPSRLPQPLRLAQGKRAQTGRLWVGGEDCLSPSSRLAAVQPATRTPHSTVGGQDGGRGWELCGWLPWRQVSHPTKWSFGGLEPASGKCSERRAEWLLPRGKADFLLKPLHRLRALTPLSCFAPTTVSALKAGLPLSS